MIKTALVFQTSSHFEDELNRVLQDLQERCYEIVDIKFQVVSSMHYALVLYKE